MLASIPDVDALKLSMRSMFAMKRWRSRRMPSSLWCRLLSRLTGSDCDTQELSRDDVD